MIIHVVQKGDTISSIAHHYNINEVKLITDNGLIKPYNLAIGQSLIILIPKVTYTVKEEDSLLKIAELHNISIDELYHNNVFLYDRDYLYPGDILTIKYNKLGSITTHGNTVPYINKDTLIKTLPYLTYLSILNYTATDEGGIVSYYDDTEIIKITKEYGVMPLMLLTTLSIQGQSNIRTAYDILINEDYQNIQIENILSILRSKGYHGVNLSFEYLNISNIQYYNNYYSRLSTRLSEEGYLTFVIINPNVTVSDNEVRFERVDYTILNQLAHNIIFMNYQWARSNNPPAPISSIYRMKIYLEYISQFIDSNKLLIGIPTIGYNWELPFSPSISSVTSLTSDRAASLAYDQEVIIQFDEISQTPFFQYTMNTINPVEHIVWFVDSRSIVSLLNLINEYKLLGSGIWNITIYDPQLWNIINALYDITKVL